MNAGAEFPEVEDVMILVRTKDGAWTEITSSSVWRIDLEVNMREPQYVFSDFYSDAVMANSQGVDTVSLVMHMGSPTTDGGYYRVVTKALDSGPEG